MKKTILLLAASLLLLSAVACTMTDEPGVEMTADSLSADTAPDGGMTPAQPSETTADSTGGSSDDVTGETTAETTAEEIPDDGETNPDWPYSPAV